MSWTPKEMLREFFADWASADKKINGGQITTSARRIFEAARFAPPKIRRASAKFAGFIFQFPTIIFFSLLFIIYIFQFIIKSSVTKIFLLKTKLSVFFKSPI